MLTGELRFPLKNVTMTSQNQFCTACIQTVISHWAFTWSSVQFEEGLSGPCLQLWSVAKVDERLPRSKWSKYSLMTLIIESCIAFSTVAASTSANCTSLPLENTLHYFSINVVNCHSSLSSLIEAWLMKMVTNIDCLNTSWAIMFISFCCWSNWNVMVLLLVACRQYNSAWGD